LGLLIRKCFRIIAQIGLFYVENVGIKPAAGDGLRMGLGESAVLPTEEKKEVVAMFGAGFVSSEKVGFIHALRWTVKRPQPS
jgi:hypothetical protein